MAENPNQKQKYDLEERTLNFAKMVNQLVQALPRTLSNLENGKQLIRSSGSVGANYIEANEALSKKDFVMRIKICRKEAKESKYWLKILNFLNEKQEKVEKLIDESDQLMKIFGSILEKSK